MYDAILFDFDGVLVDSEPLHFQCWREVIDPFGIPLDWESYQRNCIGIADEAMIRALCSLKNPPAVFDEVWATYPLKQSIFRERSLAEPPVLPETLEMIRRLELPMAVVTSSCRPEVEPLLDRMGILGSFRTCVYREDVLPNLKPLPDPYLLAAQRLGAQRPLVVEDSDPGERSGRAAGFDVLKVSSASEVPERLLAILNFR